MQPRTGQQPSQPSQSGISSSPLNAVTDTLPHNANLCKWKKLSSPLCQLCGEYQSLAHVLNSCQKALALRRYTSRHDDVLAVIFDFCKRHLPPGLQITAYLPGQYNFPQDIVTTDLCLYRHWYLEHLHHPLDRIDHAIRDKHLQCCRVLGSAI